MSEILPVKQYELYKRAFKYIRSSSKILFAAFFLSAVLSVLNGIATISFLPVFDIVFESALDAPAQNMVGEVSVKSLAALPQTIAAQFHSLYGAVAGSNSIMSRLVRLVTFIVGISFLASTLSLLADFLFARVHANGIRDLRRDTFHYLAAAPLSFYNKTKSGAVVYHVASNIGGTIAMVSKSLSDLILNIFQAVVFLLILIVINAKLLLIVLPGIALLGLLMSMLGKWITHNRQRIIALESDIFAIIYEFLAGIKIIKGFVAEGYERRRWWRLTDQWYRLEVLNNLNKAIPLRSSEVVTVITSAFILSVGGHFVIIGSLSVPELMVFFLVLLRFQTPAMALARIWFQVQDGVAYAEKTFSLLDGPTQNDKGNRHVSKIHSSIFFDKVSFNYGEGLIVEEISFSLQKGQVVALVGPSGSGKSTVADLLLRFYDPTAGRITLDGRDVREFECRSYRGLFGVVTQEAFLFHDTVRHNITYGMDREVRDEEVAMAAGVAGAHEFISQLPKGYETVVGDRGVRLSGGQRQRITIARAILRNPQVLVLDEATSALDTQSERLVQEALDKLIADRTTLVIAHRLSTVAEADIIYVLHEGRIVEQGDHQQLLGQDGLYRHLWELQSRSGV